jgi:CSLREA domain-containing protein
MATFTVTTAADTVNGSDGVTSLREALALAQANSGADTITFSSSIPGISVLTFVDLSAELLITSQGGPLTINGDIDNDGQADVILNAGSNRHFTINAGADLTLIGVDLFGGQANGAAGTTGTGGANGANGAPGSSVKELAFGVETNQQKIDRAGVDGGPGGDGAIGATGGSGTAGTDAVGSIWNAGKLTLIRSSFGNNDAFGGQGGAGGLGGRGGTGGNGGDGRMGEINYIGGVTPGGDPIPFYVDVQLGAGSLDGGDGGLGGDGANGGTGGVGGRGGNAAGAIYNAATGNITIIDSVFGGRLTSGFIGSANEATGGRGGAGGQGGLGGGGGPGGEGAMGSFYNLDATSTPAADTNFSGTPGAGGNGGNGGAAGTAGQGGNAAGNIINFGTISGNVAWGADGSATGGLGGIAGAGGAPGMGASSGDRLHYNGTNTTFTPGSTIGIPNGSGGAAGAAGIIGVAGSADPDFLNLGGTQTLQSAESLVYVHNIGIDTLAGTLKFNILRIGDSDADVTVDWSVAANGAGGITAADFTSPLSGTATLEASTAGTGGYDLTNSIETITLTLAAGVLAATPESFRITIGGLVVTNATVTALGTSSVTGFTTRNDAILLGTSGADTLSGSSLNNVVLGGDNNDRLFGNAGNDRLEGGNGNDSLDGGTGTDALFGGAGNDTYVLAAESNGTNMIFEASGIDTITSTISRSLLSFATIENLLLLGSGTISGTGNNLANSITGNAGRNRLDGGNGNDKLDGSSGNDTLLGGSGNDTLTGGTGKDSMTGGSGHDRFVFSSATHSAVGSNRDVITDFSTAGTLERIDLSAFSGAFVFRGKDAAFSSSAKEISYSVLGSNTLVKIDLDSDSAAEMEILLIGRKTLTSSDFYL